MNRRRGSGFIKLKCGGQNPAGTGKSRAVLCHLPD